MQTHLSTIAVLTASITAAAAAHGQPSTNAPEPAGAAVFTNGSVAADHWIASEAGAEMLRAGGNAVDAAVAASFTLSVVRAYSCGIGGGGFMVIALPADPVRGRVQTTLNYRERCPAAYTPNFFVDLARSESARENASTQGGHAVCVPGTVAGLLYALEHYGTLDRQVVLAPAIRAAVEGFEADGHYVRSAQEPEALGFLRGRPERQARMSHLWDAYLKRGEVAIGDRIHVPQQADAFRLIAANGADAFYRGPIGEAVVRAVRADGGLMTMDDLRAYAVVERPALESEFRGWKLLMMPPPSSGGLAAAQAFDILELRPELVGLAHNSAEYAHVVSEAFQHAFADRARWVADPEFTDVPVAKLTAPAYIARLAASIDPAATKGAEAYGSGPQIPEDGGTSHISVIDRWGGAVACTETINLAFGSLLMPPEFGFPLNNEMDDFVTIPGEPNAFGLVESVRNAPEPGKRPLSSMTPIIGLRDGRADLVVGAAGGPRIITATVQAALNVICFDMSAPGAVEAPRFHHQHVPRMLQLEPALLEHTSFVSALKKRGHTVTRRENVGVVQLIRRARDGVSLHAASDPRKGGRPAGH